MKSYVMPKKAWAIVEGEKLAIFDYRTPIYWLRRLAKRDMEKFCDGRAKVVQVLITPITRRHSK